MKVPPSPATLEAATVYKNVSYELDQARAELHAAILEDLKIGVRYADLARATGYSRERLRQLEQRHTGD